MAVYVTLLLYYRYYVHVTVSANIYYKRTVSMVFLSMTNIPNTLIPIDSAFRWFRNTFICEE